MKNFLLNINRSLLQFFPFHLVPTSPWPLLVSFSLLSLTLLAVMYMQGYPNGGIFLSLGFTITTLGMVLWFRDVIKEATYEGAHTTRVQNVLVIGFVLFIVSEAFAFLSVSLEALKWQLQHQVDAILHFFNVSSVTSLLKIAFIAFFILITLILIYLESKDCRKTTQDNIELKHSGINLPKNIKEALFITGTALATYYSLATSVNSKINEAERREAEKKLDETLKAFDNASECIADIKTENLALKAKLISTKDELNKISLAAHTNGHSLTEASALIGEISWLKTLEKTGVTLSTEEKLLVARESEVKIELNYRIQELTAGGNSLPNKIKILNKELSAFEEPSAPSTSVTPSDPSGPSNPPAQSNIFPINIDYEKFTKGLSPIELLCFANLLLDSVILNATISIIFNLYGDYLIQKFNLEIKYPKLANFIKLRKTLQKYSIIMSFTLILIGLFPQIFMCLFILLPKILEFFG